MANIELDLHYEDGRRQRQQHALPLLIGRETDCGLILKAWRVARHHARLLLREGDLWLEDEGSLFGTTINGKRVASYGPLLPTDELVIGPCLIRASVLQSGQAQNLAPDQQRDSSGSDSLDADAVVMQGLPQEGLAAAPVLADGPVAAGLVLPQAWGSLRRSLHEHLIQALQLRRRDIAGMSDEALRAEATRILLQQIDIEADLPLELDRDLIVRELVNEAVGLGPLEPLLADPGITEIMVNRHDEIFVERAGCLVRDQANFSSEQAVLGVLERIVAPLGRRIDDSAPMVDARLRDGSRVNAVISPIALRGASLTIRKFPQQRLTMSDLLAVGALDDAMANFLAHCVQHRKNLLVSGGTGSGKTSLLNILSNAIPAGERIITIEDAAELRLNHSHLVSLEARPANLEGRGQVQIRDLVRNALRMRPDRIVVGECRGGEAFDMLAAMNTGHEGSLTTLHANNPRDALGRLETMILMAGMDLPLAAVREHIAASIEIIVQLVRAADGRRLINAIVQVTGIEGGRIQLQELFAGQAGPPAVFTGCGLMPEGFVGAAALDLQLFSQRSVRQGHAALVGGEAPHAE